MEDGNILALAIVFHRSETTWKGLKQTLRDLPLRPWRVRRRVRRSKRSDDPPTTRRSRARTATIYEIFTRRGRTRGVQSFAEKSLFFVRTSRSKNRFGKWINKNNNAVPTDDVDFERKTNGTVESEIFWRNGVFIRIYFTLDRRPVLVSICRFGFFSFSKFFSFRLRRA